MENEMNEVLESALESTIPVTTAVAPVKPYRNKKNGLVIVVSAAAGSLLGGLAVFGIPKIWQSVKNKRYSKADVAVKVVKEDDFIDDDDEFFEIPDETKKK